MTPAPDLNFGLPSTIRDCLMEGQAALEPAGVDDPRLDAQVLLAEAMGVERLTLLTDPDRPMSPAGRDAYRAMIARRAAREPVSHILGRREFWSLPFRVTADTLAPRPDSETLVEAVLEVPGLRDRHALRILDLGTGTGCLVLALLSELPNATGMGVDRSARAAAVAMENARVLGFDARFSAVVSDWTAAFDQDARFDVIVSNPPYISDAGFASLPPEVAEFEPVGALKGGADGLDAYRRIIPDVRTRLRPGGLLALEVGADQGPAVVALSREGGFGSVEVRPDLAGRDRVVLASG